MVTNLRELHFDLLKPVDVMVDSQLSSAEAIAMEKFANCGKQDSGAHTSRTSDLQSGDCPVTLVRVYPVLKIGRRWNSGTPNQLECGAAELAVAAERVQQRLSNPLAFSARARLTWSFGCRRHSIALLSKAGCVLAKYDTL